VSGLGPTIAGATVMGCIVVGLFFLRFWRNTRDRLFLFFSIAFWILAAHWTALALSEPDYEFRPVLYSMRLAAFVLILLAIVDKNRAAR
jgi:hypothetical protein